MLEILRDQSKSAAGAILYVTIGTLLVIWSGLWYYFFLMGEPNAPKEQMFACLGIILSGIAVASIGLLFGLISRGAKAADTNVGVAGDATMVPVVPTTAGTMNTVTDPTLRPMVR